MKRLRWIGLALLAALALAGLGFVAWAEIVPVPEPAALAAMHSGPDVTVSSGRWLTFTPVTGTVSTGFVFYPGGKVDPRAYAPQAHAIAAEGYLVVIVPVPLHLAILAPEAAAPVLAAYPSITHWAVGGHSLGGVMAAHFAHAHPAQVQGLALWAAYPEASDDLSQSALSVVSISGSLDGLSTPAKIEASRPLLPASTTWVVIACGDHGQFGWYGPQSGDNPASISHAEQQSQTVAATVALLQGLK
jgi:hypothetical protein